MILLNFFEALANLSIFLERCAAAFCLWECFVFEPWTPDPLSMPRSAAVLAGFVAKPAAFNSSQTSFAKDMFEAINYH